jgi:SNF2 family DNA or RNA helicase
MYLCVSDLESGWEYIPDRPLSKTNSYANYLHKSKEIYLRIINQSKLEARPYQPKLAALYASRRENICGGSQGLGKTLIAGICIAAIYDLENSRPGTIHISAPSLLYATTRLIKDFNLVPELKGKIEVITSEKQIINSTSPIWVYNHDFLKRKSKQLKDTSRPYFSRLMKKLHRCPSFLLLDEAHHLKPGSERTKHFQYIRRFAKRVLLLSGTLSDGRLDILNHLLRFSYKDWNVSDGTFLKEFGTNTKLGTNYLTGDDEIEDISPRYLPHLSVWKIPDFWEVSSTRIHRVTLNDPSVKSVIKLPEMNYTPHFIKMDQDHEIAYRAYVTEHLDVLRRYRDYGDSAIGRVKALTAIQPLIELSSFPKDYVPAKLRKCKELVSEYKARGVKTVIFTSKVGAGRLVYNYLRAEIGDKNVVRLYAEDPEAEPRRMNDTKRAEVLSSFLFDPEVDIGVLSVNLAGESIDLTQASACIFYDLPWDAVKIDQARRRLVRPGAVRDWCDIHVLSHEGTIEKHIYNLVNEKLAKMTLVLDYDVDRGGSQIISSVDVLTELLDWFVPN